jgi:hypothetical protein
MIVMSGIGAAEFLEVLVAVADAVVRASAD